MAKKVYSKDERHEQAVQIGIKLGKKVGLARVSVGKVAAELKVTAPLLFHVFGSREGFHKAITKAAKAQGVVFPEAQPTVRAARAARQQASAPKKKAAAPKVVAPKPAAKKAGKKAAAPKVVAPVKKAGKVKVPKVLPPELAKFPAPVAPKVVAPKPAAKKGKSANASIPKAIAADKRARKATPESVKFPTMPAPATAVAVVAPQ